MSERTADMGDDLSPTVAARIDEVCDRFEAAWRAGRRPRIEEALKAEPAAWQTELLRHLLEVELAYRRRNREALTPGEYQMRFPEHVPLISSIFRETIRTSEADRTCLPARPPNPAPADRPLLRDFEILGELGRGTMGIVYRAYDRGRGEMVALKTVQQTGPAALHRFKIEFRSLADVTHPNLAGLYQLFSDGDHWFFTMELIDGVDFLTYVRSKVHRWDTGTIRGRTSTIPTSDECITPSKLPGMSASQLNRLRMAFRQLADGVAALHNAGRLHRDIKPSNVLVTKRGRVVLLDFGLAAELERSDLHQSSELRVVGTIAYMSPEQADSLPVSPASDWYSVGVMLYEALTGRLPFLGRSLEILLDKQRIEPPAPRELVPDVPDDLNDLCVDLLRRDPEARPAGRDVLFRLGSRPDEENVPSAQGPLPWQAVPLIGRQRHLEVLDAAFAGVVRGRTAVVYVHGRSGAGKTALVQRFLAGLVAREEAVILAGRCYEQESVPYKALDNLVDALGRYLRRLPPLEVQVLLPRDFLPLARVFPVLGRVEAVATMSRRTTEISDPQELRRRAFAALRELLARMGDRRPLVLAIDDLQWGDADSAALLSDLVRPPDPPVLLLMGCYRDEDAATSPFLRALLESQEREDAALDRRELAVDPLTEWEARDLALLLLGQDDPAAKDRAGVIARESGGNPFFVAELVRHLAAGTEIEGRSAAGEITLDEVLWGRIRRLPNGARRLLEAVAVSGRPLHQTIACRAAGLDADGFASLALLRTNHLVRGTGPGILDDVETYHDRIRETVIRHLSPEVMKSWHRDLARELENAGGADSETLAVHFEAAREPAKAGRYYAEAADAAAKALAFDRAAKLYRLALELRTTEGEGDRSLRARLGDALANAGRGVEAAHAYREAATKAEAVEVIELQRRAAYQFLISGHIDEGLATFNLLLAQVGMWLSSTPQRALLRLLLYRTVLWCRGLGFRRRDASQVPPEELLRIDIARSVALGISIVDVIEGANWQSQALLRALRGGEPLRIALTLAWQAVHSACQGQAVRRHTAKLIQAADRLSQEIGHPHAVGMVTLSAGCVEFLEGRFRPALELLDRATAILREQCAGVVWEIDTAHIFGLWTLFCLGRQGELRSRFQLLNEEARQRGDRYVEATTGTRVESLAWLAADKVEEARTRADEAVQHWSRQRFHIQHLNQLCAHLDIDLYAGDGAAAWRRLRETRPALEASLLLRVQFVRIDLLHSSGRCAVAAAAVADDPRALLRAAEGYARRLDRQRVAWASAHARLTRAGAASVRGDATGARMHLAAAVTAFDAVSMGIFAAAARRHLGELLGGTQGRDLIAQADAWMTGQGIVNPARMAAGIAPGFPVR